jgi:hypothetical protein
MNIFYLDTDPLLCAQYHNDRHCVKMVLESAQLLSTAHRLLDSQADLETSSFYAATHKNHPCAIWTRQSADNYEWLYYLFCALCDEYKLRYSKTHKTDLMLREPLRMIPTGLPWIGRTPPAQAMPEYVRAENPVRAYRNYYRLEKKHLASWKVRGKPYWWVDIS